MLEVDDRTRPVSVALVDRDEHEVLLEDVDLEQSKAKSDQRTLERRHDGTRRTHLLCPSAELCLLVPWVLELGEEEGREVVERERVVLVELALRGEGDSGVGRVLDHGPVEVHDLVVHPLTRRESLEVRSRDLLSVAPRDVRTTFRFQSFDLCYVGERGWSAIPSILRSGL